jgi:hypothetical protein
MGFDLLSLLTWTSSVELGLILRFLRHPTPRVLGKGGGNTVRLHLLPG